MDEDLMAGYDGTPTATPAADKPVQEAIPEKPEPKFVQVTEEQFADLQARAAQIDEIKATQTKGLDTAFGKIGGLERMLQTLQGTGVSEVSAADFEELGAQYPELLEATVKGMNRALAKAPKSSLDPEQLQKMITPTTREIVKHELATDRLTDMHPDWTEIVKTPEFGEYAAKLPEPEREKLNGWDARFIGSKLKEFKDSRKPPEKADTTTRKGRFDAAVNPRGTGAIASSPSDVDEFNAGYQTG